MSAAEGEQARVSRRRGVALGLLRAFASTSGVLAVYYLAPLGREPGTWLWVVMLGGIGALAALTVHQVRAILRATHPGVRAVEALATTVPMFLLLFSAAYFLMSHADTANFSVAALSRTDALYFTVTVFAPVGFGDIVPTSQVARLVVTAQMVLNLVVLGLVVRVIVGAAQHARRGQADGGSGAGS
jgi:voltage-gated potassium channel